MELPKVEIYQDTVKAERGLASWSFRIDGQESLYWSPTEYAARRVVTRLLAGRSGEAFGGGGVAGAVAVSYAGKNGDRKARAKVFQHGEMTTGVKITKSGKEKPVEKRPAFKFEIDGKVYEDFMAITESEARIACAVESFKTRGKLNPNLHKRAEEEFEERFKKKCKVHQVERKIIAKCEDQSLYLVGFEPDGEIKFKMIRPAA